MIAAWRLIRATWAAFAEDDGTALAGYIAFSSILGLFPFLILATTIAALAVGVEEGDAIIESLFTFAPSHVVQTVEPVVRDLLANASGQVLTVSALSALWFSSNSVEAVRTSFDRAYNAKPRGIIFGRLMSFAAVLAGIVAAILLGLSIVLAPLITTLVETELGVSLPGWVGFARYAVGLSVFAAYLLCLHKLLPGHRLPFSELWPGVLASTLLWIVAATGFSVYLGFTPTYVSTYGTLAGVVITLMFLYITGIAVILGAEFNAVLNRQRKGTTWRDFERSNGSS